MKRYMKQFSIFLIFLFRTSSESLAETEVIESSDRGHSLNLQQMPNKENTTPLLVDLVIIENHSKPSPLAIAHEAPSDKPSRIGLFALSLMGEATVKGLLGMDSSLFLMGERLRNIYGTAYNTVHGICNPENESVMRSGIVSCVSTAILSCFGIPETSPLFAMTVRYAVTDPFIDYVMIPTATTVWNYWGNRPIAVAVA